MSANPTPVVQQENVSANQARKLEIDARINLLYEEIEANEEENRGMESEIAKLERELKKIEGSASNA